MEREVLKCSFPSFGLQKCIILAKLYLTSFIGHMTFDINNKTDGMCVLLLLKSCYIYYVGL